MIVIICGVSGSGKTTIGRMLSAALRIPFFDADDFHPPENIEKMASGQALDDKDRQPWLELLADRLRAWQDEGGAVLACSALKESYRATLRQRCTDDIHWVFLVAPEAVLADRLAARRDHFFDRSLLGSQLQALEVPDYGWQIDCDASPQDVVNTILERLTGG